MKFGMARDLITPDIAMTMSGYGSFYGNTYQGVHDDLYVKALWMNDGKQSVLLITLDLLFHDTELTRSIQQYAQERYSIAPDNVILSYTHTHSGPAVRGYDLGQHSDYYEAFLLERIKSCINRVFHNTFSGTLSYGSVEGEWNINRRLKVDGQFENRPNPEGITDNTVHMLKITDEAGQPRGVLLNYACHPVTIRDTPYLSTDFPGRIGQLLEARLFGLTSLFFQGAGGNSRPMVTASHGDFITCTFDEIDAMSTVMANKIAHALGFGIFEPIELQLAARQFEMAIPLEPFAKEVFEEAVANESNIPLIRTTAAQVVEHYDQMADHMMLQGGIIRLSEQVYIAALGGEPCVEVKLNIAQAFPDKKLLFIGYMDSTAYIPSDKIVEEGGYEAEGSVIEYGLKGKIAVGIDRVILDAFRKQLDLLEP
ncbi:neutral/alkaline non-lysosomal ceramidase N-terminal domain-containing protein [Paenibacillus koleovorans]|uniref:neutral/alkaline non-lysosomal ceramidase N-terminal domain-containing protein n=1 Tax=Paenibacillus koleovorans TaxID=121608 RepID=UPI000FD9CD87|nr:neutral/alkaline non-lysosomal ceramidase N-terminal domain-containing protein [Paenibacillus koleovorans]